jgi:hypothetical protein
MKGVKQKELKQVDIGHSKQTKTGKTRAGAAILRLYMITSVGRRSSSEKEDAAMVGLLNWERWRR